MHFIYTLCLLLITFLSTRALAQDGHFGRGHDEWHRGFYQSLLRPDTKEPCCNLTDCRPTSGRQVGGYYEVKVNGAWVSVPPEKILNKTAPDLGSMYARRSSSTGSQIASTVSLFHRKPRPVAHQGGRDRDNRSAASLSYH
jgi:hypothetical protein